MDPLDGNTVKPYIVPLLRPVRQQLREPLDLRREARGELDERTHVQRAVARRVGIAHGHPLAAHLDHLPRTGSSHACGAPTPTHAQGPRQLHADLTRRATHMHAAT